MIRAVCFDLDDTLAPEKLFVKSGYRAVADRLAQDLNQLAEFIGAAGAMPSEEICAELWDLFCADPTNVFNRFFEGHEIDYDRDDIMPLVKLYREHIPDGDIYQLYPDVMPCIKELKDRGIKLGIISDGYLIGQKNKVASLGLYDIFDCVILTDELGKEAWKPSRLGYLAAADAMGVEADEMIYVGDNPKKDFYIQQSLPVTTVRIMREDSVYEKAEYLEGVQEEYRIDSMQELTAVIEECDRR